MENHYPDLAGVATDNLVEKIGTGNYSAAYINWARTMQLLRKHAQGWLPELVPTTNGEVLHRAPTGGFLLIRFRKEDETTPAVPQAVMDNRNAAIKWEAITARDITDTHRRGVCMAAAFTFGLAYELWAKLPLESGYQELEPTTDPAIDPRITDAAMHLMGLGDNEMLSYWTELAKDRAFASSVWKAINQETRDHINSLKGKT